jgi:hypothetical protein
LADFLSSSSTVSIIASIYFTIVISLFSIPTFPLSADFSAFPALFSIFSSLAEKVKFTGSAKKGGKQFVVPGDPLFLVIGREFRS